MNVWKKPDQSKREQVMNFSLSKKRVFGLFNIKHKSERGLYSIFYYFLCAGKEVLLNSLSEFCTVV